jgi:peptidoglycan/LPS O-acetylase OafA/YrhL
LVIPARLRSFHVRAERSLATEAERTGCTRHSAPRHKKDALIFCSAILLPLSVISIFKRGDWPPVAFYADKIVLDFLYGMVAAKLIQKNFRAPFPLAAVIIIGGLAFLFLPITFVGLHDVRGVMSWICRVIGRVRLRFY